MTSFPAGVLKSETVNIETETRVADERILSSRKLLEEDNKAAWEAVVDRLVEWGCAPEQLAEDGITPPTRRALAMAGRIVAGMRKLNAEAPVRMVAMRVVPDGNGGVVFETGGVQVFETIEIDEDGSAEYQMFAGHKLVDRHPLAL
jgi:hypothetical protein